MRQRSDDAPERERETVRGELGKNHRIRLARLLAAGPSGPAEADADQGAAV